MFNVSRMKPDLAASLYASHQSAVNVSGMVDSQNWDGICDDLVRIGVNLQRAWKPLRAEVIVIDRTTVLAGGYDAWLMVIDPDLASPLRHRVEQGRDANFQMVRQQLEALRKGES